MIRFYILCSFLLLVFYPSISWEQTYPTGSLKKDTIRNQLWASEQIAPPQKNAKDTLNCRSYPVKDQSPHETCVGHACAAAFSIGRNNKYPNLKSIEFSAAWIYQHVKQSESGNCDRGTYTEDALEWMATEGVCAGNDFPGACDGLFTAHLDSIASLHKINYLGILDPTEKKTWKDIIRTSLFYKMPVIIEMDIANSFYACKKKNVWLPKPREKPGPSLKSHTLLIVGYNDDLKIGKQKGAFKIMNSWGTDWGNSGFVWISYKHLAEWAHSAYLFDVPPPTPEGTPVLGTIHLMVVADTKHPDLGEGAQRDAYNMKNTWQEIAIGNQYRLKKYVFIGKDVLKQKIEECINKMSIDSNDIVVFYFSGYGIYSVSGTRGEPGYHLNMSNGIKYEVPVIIKAFQQRKTGQVQNPKTKREPLYLFLIDISDNKLDVLNINRPFRGLLFKKKKYEALVQESLCKEQHHILQQDTSMQFYGLLSDWQGTIVAINRMPPNKKNETVFTTPFGSHFTNGLVTAFRYFAHREADWYSVLLYAASKARQFSYVARRFHDDELTADFELKLKGLELQRRGPRYPPLPTEPPFHKEQTDNNLLNMWFETFNKMRIEDIRQTLIQTFEDEWAKNALIIRHSGDTQLEMGNAATFLRQWTDRNYPDFKVIKVERYKNGEPREIHIRY